MSRPLHIVMTVNAAWNIHNFRLPLVEALLRDGHRVTVLAPADDTAAKLEAVGACFVPLKMDRTGLNPVRDAGLTWRFMRHFRTLRPDVVLGFTIKNNLFGALAAKSLGIPFVPNVTGLGTAFLGNRLLAATARLLYRIAFRGLPVVFFQNVDDRALFIRDELVEPGQTRLLPGSGIDLAKFAATQYPGEGPVRFLMIARLLRDKGVYEFVEAARMLRSDGVGAEFALLGEVGSQNRSAVSRTELDNWLREGVVRYLGTSDDVRPEIARAHCIVLPSYREGAPRTLIEGAAMARPAIATDVPGCTAVVEDRRSGLLCKSHDAGSLAQAMHRFLELDATAQARMGAEARKKMERDFSVELVIREYRKAVTELEP